MYCVCNWDKGEHHIRRTWPWRWLPNLLLFKPINNYVRRTLITTTKCIKLWPVFKESHVRYPRASGFCSYASGFSLSQSSAMMFKWQNNTILKGHMLQEFIKVFMLNVGIILFHWLNNLTRIHNKINVNLLLNYSKLIILTLSLDGRSSLPTARLTSEIIVCNRK